MSILNSQIKLALKNSTYLTDYRFCFTYNTFNNDLSGCGVSYDSIRLATLSSIGEFIERENMFSSKMNERIYKNNFIVGYSVLQNKTVKVAVEKVISLYSKQNFVDSCGQASHINSSDCIKNAIKEFIERQSYIFNYLSKSKAKLINLKNETKFKYLLNKYNSFEFYNISLIDNFYVILCKGIYNNNFHIGLGSSNDIDEAIYKALKECILCGYAYDAKEKNKNKDKKTSDYADIFLSIPTEKLNTAYNYLNNNCTSCEYKDLVSYPFCIENIFMELNRKYKMDPLILFLTPSRKIDSLKIVKILDLNWFPSLAPKFYGDDVYDFIESVTGKKLDRICNFLPFH